MGLEKTFSDLIENTTLNYYSKLEGLDMLELGNQLVQPNDGIPERIAKQYWTRRGFNHTSVDVNGKNGALQKDLTAISDFTELTDSFDVVYNAGTSEHVEPYNKQYDCFKIIDMCCRVGGLMFHDIPEITNRDLRGVWKKHCHYYYSHDFFETLAKECNYELLTLELTPTIIRCALRKTKESVFMEDQQKFLSGIHVRNLDLDYSKNPNYIFQTNYKAK